MAKLEPAIAIEILNGCDARDQDFHALGSETVDALLAYADEYGYRKPRGANGSRGRYWHAYLVRQAVKSGTWPRMWSR